MKTTTKTLGEIHETVTKLCTSPEHFAHLDSSSVPRKCPHQAPMLEPTVKRSNGTATTEMKKPKSEKETNLSGR